MEGSALLPRYVITERDDPHPPAQQSDDVSATAACVVQLVCS
jgi:hypothetical protein